MAARHPINPCSLLQPAGHHYGLRPLRATAAERGPVTCATLTRHCIRIIIANNLSAGMESPDGIRVWLRAILGLALGPPLQQLARSYLFERRSGGGGGEHVVGDPGEET